MNLKEALKLGKLKQFAKEHEINPAEQHPLGQERFDHLMEAMSKASKDAGTTASTQTSSAAPSSRG